MFRRNIPNFVASSAPRGEEFLKVNMTCPVVKRNLGILLGGPHKVNTTPILLSDFKNKYREQCKILHPDCGGSAKEFKETMDAYQTLMKMHKEGYGTGKYASSSSSTSSSGSTYRQQYEYKQSQGSGYAGYSQHSSHFSAEAERRRRASEQAGRQRPRSQWEAPPKNNPYHNQAHNNSVSNWLNRPTFLKAVLILGTLPVGISMVQTMFYFAEDGIEKRKSVYRSPGYQGETWQSSKRHVPSPVEASSASALSSVRPSTDPNILAQSGAAAAGVAKAHSDLDAHAEPRHSSRIQPERQPSDARGEYQQKPRYVVNGVIPITRSGHSSTNRDATFSPEGQEMLQREAPSLRRIREEAEEEEQAAAARGRRGPQTIFQQAQAQQQNQQQTKRGPREDNSREGTRAASASAASIAPASISDPAIRARLEVVGAVPMTPQGTSPPPGQGRPVMLLVSRKKPEVEPPQEPLMKGPMSHPHLKKHREKREAQTETGSATVAAASASTSIAPEPLKACCNATAPGV